MASMSTSTTRVAQHAPFVGPPASTPVDEHSQPPPVQIGASFTAVNPTGNQASARKMQSTQTATQQTQQAQQTAQSSSQQSFSMSQPSSQQTGVATTLYRSHSDLARITEPNPMPIYTATYSGVNVYEMEANGVAVMRRAQDSWLNATQILKVAGVEKGRRTKILEKEIQTGEHEKIQGGYGKYQGTWIPFGRGLEVCRQYGVEAALQTLLTHNMQGEGRSATADVDTPTKEQAMAAQRKRMYNAGTQDTRTNGISGTFFKNISDRAASAVAAISKARFDSSGARPWNGGQARAHNFNRQSSTQNGDDLPGNSQQSAASDYAHSVDLAYSSSQQPLNGDGVEPPRKRQRIAMTPADSFGYANSAEMYASAFPGSPTEPNESFIYNQAGVGNKAESFDEFGPLSPLPFEVSPEAEIKRGILMRLFLDAPQESVDDVLRTLTPQEVDVPIDHHHHTALHWAATLSRMPLLRALISCGANPFRVNAAGETALMRACAVTNSMDLTSFPELLDVLGGTMDIRDNKGRTVLHHIAVTSAVKGRNAASRYYLDSLLEWVVRQGSAPSASSQNLSGANGNGPPKMILSRFMSDIVNSQDNSGDTALNIAARINNRSIVSQLLEVGADPNIANQAGLRPRDFGIGEEFTEDKAGGQGGGAKNGSSSGQKGRQSSDDVVRSISHLMAESTVLFQSEVKAKQNSIDALHASLRTTSAQVGEARRILAALEAKLKAQQLERQKVSNLSIALEEEQAKLRELNQPPREPIDVDAVVSWEEALDAALSNPQAQHAPALPLANVLRARIKAVRGGTQQTTRAVADLKTRSRDLELKYRRVVSLCTGRPAAEVDVLMDGLTRAVESEKKDLAIGRVRRFLGGVDSMAG